MADNRMDIMLNKHKVQNIEDAHFVLLLLYREYSIRLLQDTATKEDCIIKMKQIKKDITELSENELITKAEQIYLPLLGKLKSV